MSYDSQTIEMNFSEPNLQGRNPLVCFICQDYYSEPCLLHCYHTFCARCLRGRDIDGKLSCPLCGQQTILKDNAPLPPSDLLMTHLIELVNSENPPCSNCDKRDRNNMFYCSTCGQALCNHCRENTHRAKMFATHDVLHMSKCSKEPKKCPVHGEQYIMFSNAQRTMLCVNCFRDTQAEQRTHCIDIDTAYSQASKRLDRAQGGIIELQNSVRDGLIMLKNLLDELQQNMDSEKHTINTFCQGMQEAIAKTHANMIMEVQRQYETKERVFRSQLVTLGTVLPVLQLHLLLCSTFANSANKFQFLELAYLMFDRLNSVSQLSHPLRPIQSSTIRTNYRNEFAQSLEPWVGKSVLNPTESTSSIYESANVQQPSTQSSQIIFSHPSKKQQSVLKMKLLEDESPFSNHCRSFDTQIKELTLQLTGVKERLGELHRDITILRRASMPPINIRYECVARDCTILDENLERHQVELDRLKVVFDTLWEEQLCRIHVEQDIFHSQMNDVIALRSELKHLSSVAQQLEPFIKNVNTQQQQPPPAIKAVSQQQLSNDETTPQQLQSLLEQIGLLQLESSLREKSECKIHPSISPTSDPTKTELPVKDSSRIKIREQQQSLPTQSSTGLLIGEQQKRNVISQLIEKVSTRDRKKSPTDEHRACTNVACFRERERSKSTGSSSNIIGDPKSSTSGKVKSSKADKAYSGGSQTIERLESHIKDKLHDILCHSNLNRCASKMFEAPGSSTQSFKTDRDLKSESKKTDIEFKSDPKSIELKFTDSKEFASLVHRKLSKSDIEKLAMLSSTSKVQAGHKKIGKSCDKLDELRALKMAAEFNVDTEPREKKRSGDILRSKTPDSATLQHFRSKTPETFRQRSETTENFQCKSELFQTCRARLETVEIPRAFRSKSEHKMKSSESEYQRIADATSSANIDFSLLAKHEQALQKSEKYKHNRSTPSSPKSGKGKGKKTKVYPFSDGEDAVFYRDKSSAHASKSSSRENLGSKKSSRDSLKKRGSRDRSLEKTSKKETFDGTITKKGGHRQNSFESLSTLSLNSRRSSLEGPEKTLVLVIGTRSKTKAGEEMDFATKQRSWETFPPKRRHQCATKQKKYIVEHERHSGGGYFSEYEIDDNVFGEMVDDRNLTFERTRARRTEGAAKSVHKHIGRFQGETSQKIDTPTFTTFKGESSHSKTIEPIHFKEYKDSFGGQKIEPGMKKADSFEGHEEAVRTLVAAVQETRSQNLAMARKSKSS